MWSDAEARNFIASQLLHDAEAQESGRLDEIGAGFVTFEANAPTRPGGWLDPVLGSAYTFWDCWVDARNHNWQHYPGMTPEDWPPLARQIAAGVQAGEDPSPLVAPLLGRR